MQTRKKAFSRRSRTGCQACRVRRIKCDETPGGCDKCKSAGWKCEGADVIRLSQPARKGWQSPSPPLNVRSLASTLPTGNVEERRAFVFFQCLTVPSLTGFFDSRLWRDLILPMSHSERAVNHAIVALSALHEDLEVRGVPLSRENLTLAHHQFALNQYGRSLAALNERRHSKDPKLREVILTCCLLFVTFELMRGQYDPALLHLKQGLAIMEETRPTAESPFYVSTGITTVERLLSATMARFETQSVFYGMSPLMHLPMGPGNTDHSPGFQALLEARGALDQIIARIVRLWGAAFIIPVEERLPNFQPDLAQQQHELGLQLTTFFKRLQASPLYTSDTRDRKEQRGLDLIRLHYLTFSCLLETVLCGLDNSIFDDYLANFRQMLNLSKRISDSFVAESTSGTRPTLLLDMGIIPPLFILCLRCRNFDLRRQAFDLLRMWPHREGIWDSRLLVIFIQQQFQLEIQIRALSPHSRTPPSVQELSLEVSDDQKYAIIRYQTHEHGKKPQDRQKIISLIENS